MAKKMYEFHIRYVIACLNRDIGKDALMMKMDADCNIVRGSHSKHFRFEWENDDKGEDDEEATGL